ncbi:MAG: Uma2 family endonuclease [Acidobacteria bacterium]|nr:Uma2 family endonuclease [Acidobacteriota bacterium]
MMTTTMPQPVQLRFTVDDYYKMIELGILKDYEKAEIIEGELIKKMTVGDKHAAVVNFLTRFFVKNVSDDILVSVQNPVRLSQFNEAQPDLTLADLRKFDGKRHPRPDEVILIIEVSDSTVKYDRNKKLPLYAEAKISEVWIINLLNEIVEVHTKPSVGLYQSVKIFRRGEIVQSEVLPDLSLQVDSVL